METQVFGSLLDFKRSKNYFISGNVNTQHSEPNIEMHLLLPRPQAGWMLGREQLDFQSRDLPGWCHFSPGGHYPCWSSALLASGPLHLLFLCWVSGDTPSYTLSHTVTLQGSPPSCPSSLHAQIPHLSGLLASRGLSEMAVIPLQLGFGLCLP